MTRRAAIVTAALVLAGVGVWQNLRAMAVEPLPILYTLGGDFTLPSTLGREVGLTDFRGEVVLLNFGFTRCPDVCPTALARMRDVLRDVRGDKPELRPLFVTLDPERDPLDRIAPYLAFFDERFVGMSGPQPRIDEVSAQFRVYAKKEVLDSELEYTIAHSAHIYLIDRLGRVRATFGESVTVAQMVDGVERLLAEPSA